MSLAQTRYRAKQGARIGMGRGTKYRADFAAFNNAARIHYCYAVADRGGHTQVVRNQNYANFCLALNALEQLHHLDLYSHIKIAGWLISDQQSR